MAKVKTLMAQLITEIEVLEIKQEGGNITMSEQAKLNDLCNQMDELLFA